MLQPYKVEKESRNKWLFWVLLGLGLVGLVGVLVAR
jgi:hypothetical protein